MASYSKKKEESQAHLVLIDETGLFLQPIIKRSWAPIGLTPLLQADGGYRQKVSVIGGITISPKVSRLGFYFATEPNGFFNTEKVIEYLKELLKHLRGNVIVLWDGGSNHKGTLMREFLKKTPRLHLEFLPPWAPEYNPVEFVWGWLKWNVLANYAPEDIDRLDETIIDHLLDLKIDQQLIKSLWVRSELPFPKK